MNRLLSEPELAEYTKGNSIIDRLRALLDHQIDNWSLTAKNYKSLNSIQTKSLIIDGEEVILQHNPERVTSTTANVEEKVVKNRKCILCEENLPEEQRYLNYYKEYRFLVNPFPILNEHFTVAKTKHTPQALLDYFNDLLLISRDVGERYAVFYNGPKCGASLPEHLHFQIGNKDQLPIVNQVNLAIEKNANLVAATNKIKLISLNSLKRKAFVAESNNSVEILNFFSILNSFLKKVQTNIEEPKLNIVSLYDRNKWKVIIFLRKLHRPSYYYKPVEPQILVSPASIDMSGLIVAPRRGDLQKLTPEIIKEIYREVSITKELNEFLIYQLKNFYN